METKVFAECMKRNMDIHGITTEVLSEKTGISVARLKELESGEIKAKAKELFAIGPVIKVPPLILIEGGGKVHSSYIDENGHRMCKWEEF